MKLAIFDLDETVLRVNSWHVYFSWVLRNRPAWAPLLLSALVGRVIGLTTSCALHEKALRPLRGFTDTEVEAVGRELLERHLKMHIRERARCVLRERVAEGFVPVLATGAFEFVARAVANNLGIGFVVCSRLSFDEQGQCRGRLLGPETRGAAKAYAVRALFDGVDVDWPGSIAYSDHPEDAPLFALVGRTVLVSSSPRRLEGYCVEYWA